MNIDKKLSELANTTRDDLRDLFDRNSNMREYIWPALGLVSAGLIIGAGTALLFAPKSGAKLRADISDEFRSRLDKIEARLRKMTSTAAHEVADKAEQVADRAEETASEMGAEAA